MTGQLSRALQGRFVLAEVADSCPEPPLELVLGQRPAVSDLVDAVAVLGAFPDGSYLSGEIRVSLLTL